MLFRGRSDSLGEAQKGSNGIGPGRNFLLDNPSFPTSCGEGIYEGQLRMGRATRKRALEKSSPRAISWWTGLP